MILDTLRRALRRRSARYWRGCYYAICHQYAACASDYLRLQRRYRDLEAEVAALRQQAGKKDAETS